MKKFLTKYFSLIILLLALFLRLVNLGNSPPSPYWEEVALGYDAYSISMTGADHHGNAWPLTAFESFGDWKPSLYFYLAAPFIKIFGLQVFAVRLPSILAGVAIVWGIAFLARHLYLSFYDRNNSKLKTAQTVYLFALLIASISPWAITLSRGAWESNVATALILWGINLFLVFVGSQKRLFLLLSVLLLGLSTYAYHAARFAAPLVGVVLGLLYLFSRKNKIDFAALLMAGILATVIFLPVFLSLQSSVGQQRIAQTSIFNDVAVIEESNQLRDLYRDHWWGYFISHRYLLFAREICLNFFDHFSWNYLFVSGDNNPRHSIQSVGQFYYLDLLFFLAAVVFFCCRSRRITYFLLALLTVLILPSAFTNVTPHALRSLAAMPIYLLFVIFGSLQIWQWCLENSKKYLFFILSFFYALQFIYFSYQLHFVYPVTQSREWQFGYEEMLLQLRDISANYDKVYITREQGRPAMYYFFYNQIDPSLVQAANEQVSKDQGEFLQFQNVFFIDNVSQIDLEASSVIVSSQKFYEEHFAARDFKVLARTKQDIWLIYEN